LKIEVGLGFNKQIVGVTDAQVIAGTILVLHPCLPEGDTGEEVTSNRNCCAAGGNIGIGSIFWTRRLWLSLRWWSHRWSKGWRRFCRSTTDRCGPRMGEAFPSEILARAPRASARSMAAMKKALLTGIAALLLATGAVNTII
jgi:hypothetical protein